MRIVRLIALAGALSAPLPLLAADDPAPYGYVCSAVVSGVRGEAMAAMIAVDLTGRPIGATASWTPPQQSDPGSGELDRPDIAFHIYYVHSSAQLIGQPVTSNVTLSVFAPPRQRTALGKLSARLNGYTGVFRFDDAAFVPLKYLDVGPDDSLPGTASRTALLDLPQPMPRWLDVSVLDAKRRPVASTRFVLDATASRDALFAQAWAQAQNSAAKYKSCAPTLD